MYKGIPLDLDSSLVDSDPLRLRLNRVTPGVNNLIT